MKVSSVKRIWKQASDQEFKKTRKPTLYTLRPLVLEAVNKLPNQLTLLLESINFPERDDKIQYNIINQLYQVLYIYLYIYI